MSRWSEIGRELAGIPGEVLRHHADSQFEEGFNVAANVCVDLLSAKIDDLAGKMKAGELSGPEQVFLSSLTDLKAETERSLYGYWEAQGATD